MSVAIVVFAIGDFFVVVVIKCATELQRYCAHQPHTVRNRNRNNADICHFLVHQIPFYGVTIFNVTTSAPTTRLSPSDSAMIQIDCDLLVAFSFIYIKSVNFVPFGDNFPFVIAFLLFHRIVNSFFHLIALRSFS